MFANYLTQDEAKEFDAWLMSPAGGGFTLEQLMELAGLAVALSITRFFPDTAVLVVCGPGNNGGDGLVAARHLATFGHQVAVYYPKRNDGPLFTALVTQCIGAGVSILDTLLFDFSGYSLLVDALFGENHSPQWSHVTKFAGFGFRGPLRSPFDGLVQGMIASGLPIVSVDHPTGWDMATGPPQDALQPTMLISLTAPKQSARHFAGQHHILGGRFIPRVLPDTFRKLSHFQALYKNDDLLVILSHQQ